MFDLKYYAEEAGLVAHIEKANGHVVAVLKEYPNAPMWAEKIIAMERNVYRILPDGEVSFHTLSGWKLTAPERAKAIRKAITVVVAK